MEYDFEYDINGNMTKDRNKSIDSISYNHLNLPVSIVFETLPQQINYVYDATGVKLEKSVTNEGTIFTQYAGNFMYNGPAGDLTLQFFNHPEGYIEPVADTGKSVKGSFGGTTTYSSYSYVFQYKDHLGNVRLSYSDSNLDGAITQSEIIEESNYYPFGLKQKGYNNNNTGNGNALAQAFKFGGKEYNEEHGLDWYDVTARNYDPAIGRWMNLDPLAEQMRRHSPYNYGFDNPIYFLDPDGMAPTDDYYNRKGEYLYSDTRSSNDIRIISQSDWDNIEENYSDEISDSNSSYGELLNELDSKSKKVSVNVSNSDIKKMWDDSSPNSKDGNLKKEQGAYIVLDVENASLDLVVHDDALNTRDRSANPGVEDEIDSNNTYMDSVGTKLVVGQVHTHPNTKEEGYSIEPSDADQGVARAIRAPVYTIEHGGNVDKLTPSSKKNNYGTIEKTNIALDALKTKGGKQF